ncbi:unnamed protein product [Notodromas monacha]|uniref:Uncharacterized protein n=1 Tax=Notodromas monacha TaxID=399045 RepID=A0A7R9BJM9_9CRUS|nr:unnamed protein product [Notodromas monacha]CAG0915968.1 unnamed protein product [Notodromas monacha]
MNGNHTEKASSGAELGENLASLIHDLSPGQTQDTMRILCTTITTKCRDEDCLRDCVEVLHLKCLENRDFGRKFAQLCAKIQGFQVGSVNFRGLILDRFQLDFQARGLTRDKSYAKYLNSIALLYEVLVEMRMVNGSPVPVLVSAASDYLFNFIDDFATEDSIMECCRQVQRAGEMIQKQQPEVFEKFLVAVKTKLIDGQRLTNVSRACLVCILDFASRDFKPFKINELSVELYSKKGVPLAAFGFCKKPETATVSRRSERVIYQPPHVKHGMTEPSVPLMKDFEQAMTNNFLVDN